MGDHVLQLESDNDNRMASAGLDTSQVDKSDKIQIFEQNVRKHINLLEQDLKLLKKDNTTRFKVTLIISNFETFLNFFLLERRYI